MLLELVDPFPHHVRRIDAIVEAGLPNFNSAHERGPPQRGCSSFAAVTEKRGAESAIGLYQNCREYKLVSLTNGDVATWQDLWPTSGCFGMMRATAHPHQMYVEHEAPEFIPHFQLG